MKRFAVAIGAAGVLTVSGLGMGTAIGGSGDSVSGAIKRTGVSDDQERHFVVSAHQGANGKVNGSYQATYGKGKSRTEYHGRAVCVEASGNFAYVGIVVTSSTRPDVAPGDGQVIRVTDGGNPDNGQTQDMVSPGAITKGGQPSCSGPQGGTVETFTGNVLVKDGGS
jgi:hypothetical protein